MEAARQVQEGPGSAPPHVLGVAPGHAVRAILAHHVSALTASRAGPSPSASPGSAAPTPDPNDLVPAAHLAEALAALDPAGQRHAAAAYVALWRRTFKTLVRHLRGRPERAVALFAEEVYPFLRGDRLAARVASARPDEARLVLLDDLPQPYLEGLLEGFVALSGARATARAVGAGTFEVRYRIDPSDRLARVAQRVALQRIHLLAAAALACLVGIAVARAPLVSWPALAVLLGGISAQLGANAMHDLRHPHPAGPLNLRTPNRQSLLWQARLGYLVAAGCGLALATRAPAVLAFAGAGIVLGWAFGNLRNVGWGPIVAGLTYGPLMVAGAWAALVPPDATQAALQFGSHAQAALASGLVYAAPLGLGAAAVLYVDDLADRPLDEAGGQRTLIVRLPRRRHLLGYAALVLAATAALGAALAWLEPSLAWVAAAFGLAAVALVDLVRRHVDDPRGLAPARMGTLALHAAIAAAILIATWSHA